MARRRKKRMPTKVERLTRRLAAVEWALTQAYESCARLQADILRLTAAECPRCLQLATPERPPVHRDADAPPDFEFNGEGS